MVIIHDKYYRELVLILFKAYGRSLRHKIFRVRYGVLRAGGVAVILEGLLSRHLHVGIVIPWVGTSRP